MSIDSIIDRMRRWRRYEGMSKTALAAAAGLSVNCLTRMEEPAWSPTASTIRAIEAVIPTDFPYRDRLEHERDMISQRTKSALAAAKARGVVLGKHGRTVLAPRNRADADAFAHEIAGTVEQLRREGATTVRALTEAMNASGVPTRNGGRWHAQTIHRLLRRLDKV